MNSQSNPNSLVLPLLLFVVLLVMPKPLLGQEGKRRVKVMPVFFVPKGQAKPTDAEAAKLQRHLEWAQRRFREMLHGQSTFEIEGNRPQVYRAEKTLGHYRKMPEGGAPAIVDELLRGSKTNRFSCSHIFLAVVMNPKDSFPKGGGRPFNGGFNTGGGIVKISSYALNNSPNFQSTLQHELGHSFGLLHVDAYGYNMKQSESIMAYNKRHHTSGFNPSRQPGELIPEDFRGLALNSRVFKNLEFNQAKHLPKGYKLAEIRTLRPMKIPGHPNAIKVTTNGGETFDSSVRNVVQNRIRKSLNRGKIEFDKKTMWHSDKLKKGWARVTLEFSDRVRLDRVGIYSQHSGKAHAVVSARISTVDSNGNTELRSKIRMTEQDGELAFETATSKVWRLELKAGESGKIVIRGIRLFHEGQELFPSLIPLDAEK